MAGVLGGHQVDHERRHPTPQILTKLLGPFLRLTSALRIEDQDDTIKTVHESTVRSNGQSHDLRPTGSRPPQGVGRVIADWVPTVGSALVVSCDRGLMKVGSRCVACSRHLALIGVPVCTRERCCSAAVHRLTELEHNLSVFAVRLNPFKGVTYWERVQSVRKSPRAASQRAEAVAPPPHRDASGETPSAA